MEPTTPAGWYLDVTNSALERYWDGSGWTPATRELANEAIEGQAGAGSQDSYWERYRNLPPVSATSSATPVAQATSAAPSRAASRGVARPKKKPKVFLWFFLAVQALFIAWIAYGVVATGDTSSCSGDQFADACRAGATVGGGLAIFLILIIWFFVDFFLAVIYGVYRLAKR